MPRHLGVSGRGKSALAEETVKELMRVHLSTARDELVAWHTENHIADVAAYDTVYDHILVMPDTLSGGIVQQCPEKFGK
jgi:RNA-splicing ligase RtcB